MALTEPTTADTPRSRMLYKCAQGIAIVAGIFSIVVVILLAASWLRIKDAPPTDSDLMKSMIERAKDDPNNAQLANEIREFDMLARRAQFEWWDFSRRGAWLLFAGLVTFAAAIKLMSSLRLDLPAPGEERPGDGHSLARWAVVCFALVLAGLAFALHLRGKGRTPIAAMPRPADTGDKPAEPVKPQFPEIAEWKVQWPGFRGYDGLGVADASCKPPTDWDGATGRNIRWKSPIPVPGHNSPVVWGDRIFLSSSDGKQRVVYCYSAADGKMLWQTEVAKAGKPLEEPFEDTGHAPNTMATNGLFAYVVYPTGDLACLTIDGKEVWTQTLPVREFGYGYASSLRAWKDLLLVQMDAGEEHHGKLIAYDAETGKVRWEANRGDPLTECWSTPVIVEDAGATTLILSGNPEVRAYSLPSGKQLWKLDCMGGEPATTPTYHDGNVFVAQAYAQCAAIDVKTGKLVWGNDEVDLPEICSPVAYKGLIYMPVHTGAFTCISTAGKKIWDHTFPVGFFASPVAADNKVYLMNRKGEMLILEAGNKFTMLATPKLGEKSVCTAAFIGNRIYIRGDKHLWCIEAK